MMDCNGFELKFTLKDTVCFFLWTSVTHAGTGKNLKQVQIQVKNTRLDPQFLNWVILICSHALADHHFVIYIILYSLCKLKTGLQNILVKVADYMLTQTNYV